VYRLAAMTDVTSTKSAAIAFEKAGDWASALDAWRRAFAFDAKDAQTRRRIGQCLYNTRALDAADKFVRETLKFFPGDAASERLLGAIARSLPSWHRVNAVEALKAEDYPAAVHHLERWHELQPDNESCIVWLDRARSFLPGLGQRLRGMDGAARRRRIYVAGCARSGTWLATALMSCFADVQVVAEESMFGRFLRIEPRASCIVLKRSSDAYTALEHAPGEIEIVYVVRHPFDVLTSVHTGRERYATPERWKSEMAAFKSLLTTRGSGFHVLAYEDMVLEPTVTQKLMSEALNLNIRHPFARFDEIVSFDGNAIAAMHGLRAPDCSSVGRWRRDK
jgi:tetratricopeptide (TPR) repeat protein